MSTKRYKKSSHHRAKTHRTRDEIEAELEMARKAREESAANNVEGGDNGSSSEEEDSESKRKGVQGLLETGNLNRDNSIKADDDDEPRLTRKEREALEKKKAKERYLKAYVEGRTPEAKSDLARLQKIRAERQAAANRRREEEELKEERKSAARARDLGTRASTGKRRKKGRK